MQINNYESSQWIVTRDDEIWIDFKYTKNEEAITLGMCKTPFFLRNVQCFRFGFCASYTERFPSNLNSDYGWYRYDDPKSIEKILRICDSIFPLSQELINDAILLLKVKEYKIKSSFIIEIFNTIEANYKSIPTFLLCMNRWKIDTKVITPKVLQIKILCNLTDKELGPSEFKQNLKWIQEE